MPYHFIQMLWFGIFLSAVAWIGLRSVGMFASFLILLLVANGHYWANIWGNSLLAAEQTASGGLGFVLFGYGLFCIWFIGNVKGKLDGSLLLASIGTLICVGSKENFILLTPLNLIFLLFVVQKKAAANSAILISLGCVSLQAVICYGIIHANFYQLSNAHAGSGLSARLAAVFHVKRLVLRICLAWAGGIVAAFAAFAKRTSLSDQRSRELVILSAFLIGSGLYVCWEQFFYNGLLPTGYRYDFPALLIDPILAGSAFYAATRARERFSWVRGQFSPLFLKALFAQSCIVFLLWPATTMVLDKDTLLHVIPTVKISSEHSRARARDLERAHAIASEHPDWPIVIRVNRPTNYEAVLSLPVWLDHSGIKNPTVVKVDIQSAEVPPDEKGMVEDMRNLSRSGQPGQYLAWDAVMPNALVTGHCYLIQFGDGPAPCVKLPYHPDDYFPAY
jgi:hypothetical protein